MPKPQSKPDSKPEVDKLDIDRLQLEQNSPKEEQIKVTDSLIPPPMTSKEEEKAMMEEMMEETMEEITKVEKICQQEEETYVLQEKV